METGIVGLPLSGKTTLFNLLTRSDAETGFAAGKKRANVGVSRVPDRRLERLSEIWSPRKTTPATIQYVDVAGLEKGPGGDGLSSDVLGHLKNTDALAVVIRGFMSDRVPHPESIIDPLRDLATIQTELILSDLIILEHRLERIAKQLKAKADKSLEMERAVLERCGVALAAEQPLRNLDFTPDEARVVRGFQFLTQKPVIIVINLGEDDLSRAAEIVAPIEAQWGGPMTAVTYMCATIEDEISQLSPEDARTFMDHLGIERSALDRIIRATYGLLGLISFLTMGEDECRAWTVRGETTAPQAARVIHSDLERGFIRAEVVTYDAFAAAGSLNACRNHGLLRVEGKAYVVQDGDILNIRFNV
jgi:GTP-binding protein YchF